MKVLVSNDDGIFAPGISALAEAMAEIADEVIISAPDVEQSAAGHAITIRRPLRYIPTNLDDLAHMHHVKAYRVDGTPTDCVLLGAHKSGRPDVVVSGINIGQNVGYDVTHSGTVAAALEGTTMNIPSIAFSLEINNNGRMDFTHAAHYAKVLVPRVLEHGLPPKTLLNVNIPEGNPKGVKVVKQSEYMYEDEIIERIAPDGKPYYWIGGQPSTNHIPDTDITALREGYISVTPLHLDLTFNRYLDTLKTFTPDLPS